MSDLVVIAFDDETTGFQLRADLVKMQREYLIALDDAVVVTRDGEAVKLHQAINLTAAGAAGGGLWGALIGLIFLNPVAGAAVGAGAGAIAGMLSDTGIDDNFIREVGHSVAPGGSAVFLLIRSVTTDKVLARIEAEGYRGRVLRSSLSEADEARLSAAFAGQNVTS